MTQKLLAYGFAGIVFAFGRAAAGGSLGFMFADVDNARLDEYFLHIPFLFTKTVGTTIGAILGGAIGFPHGILAYAFTQSRAAHRQLDRTQA